MYLQDIYSSAVSSKLSYGFNLPLDINCSFCTTQPLSSHVLFQANILAIHPLNLSAPKLSIYEHFHPEHIILCLTNL